MALTRVVARGLTVTRYLTGLTSTRLSLSALQQRFISSIDDAEGRCVTPVQTDANILKTEVCGTNLFVEGGENVKIKPDSEYPDWLWELHLGKPLQPHELDPNTREYWECVYKLGKLREEKFMKLIPCKRERK